MDGQIGNLLSVWSKIFTFEYIDLLLWLVGYMAKAKLVPVHTLSNQQQQRQHAQRDG